MFDEFSKGLSLYRDGKWHQAMQLFDNILKIYPNDKPSKLFLNRCKILIENEPEHWDGTWQMTTK
jgi:adenylate cyclase